MGWESGAGFGHVAPMRLVARALLARGHKPVMALRDVVEPAPMLKDEPYPILQGPFWGRAAMGLGGKPFSAATFADILAVGGFGNADELSAMMKACDALIDVVRPDLVIAEYAPMLALAARGRVPAILFGTGFTVPPADLPVYPRIQAKVPHTMLQEKVLAVVQEVQKRRGKPVPKTLPEILACDRRFPCTFPEVDPYRSVRREAVLAPLGDLPPPSPAPAKPRFFAYLAADAAGLQRVVLALGKSGVPGGIFLRNPPPRLKEELGKTNLVLYDGPQPMTEVMRDASFIVHHGGAGTTEACLAAGRGQLLFPRHLEQWTTARALRSLGVADTITRDMTEEAVIESVRKFANDPQWNVRAGAVSADIASRGPRPGVAPIVDAGEELMSRRH